MLLCVLLVLVLGDVVLIGHVLEHQVSARQGVVRVRLGVVATRVRDQAGEHGGLPWKEL
jgi:hypothetical protein